LSKRDVVIVSAEPGTTRDLIEVRLDIGGYPFTLVDTAGLREATGEVEREGIIRAGARARAADVVVRLADVTAPSGDGLRVAPGPGFSLKVGTKVDLVDSAAERERLSGVFDLLVSSKTGQGLDALVAWLGDFARTKMEPGESSLITRARHRSSLSTCREALIAALDGSRPLELRAEELRRATEALGRLTGRVDVEDLLDVIFRDFCIGK
jgi:tRNA modification GTPase